MGRFADALREPGLVAIAEIKRRSPSAGDLRPDADPAGIAASYGRAGAAAVSVLVDERFAGTWDDLRAARAATDSPLLAKGFFSTPDDLRTAKEAGADAVLLLLRDLDDAQVMGLLGEAGRLALDTLVEAHDADEVDRGIALGAPGHPGVERAPGGHCGRRDAGRLHRCQKSREGIRTAPFHGHAGGRRRAAGRAGAAGTGRQSASPGDPPRCHSGDRFGLRSPLAA